MGYRLSVLTPLGSRHPIEDAVKAAFRLDLLGAVLEGEISVGDLDGEVFGHLAAVHHRTHRDAHLGGPWRRRMPAPELCLVVACAITSISCAP